MTNDTCRFVSLAVASVIIPAGRDEESPAGTHLAAMALLIAERDTDLNWSFKLEAEAIGAGDSEDALLKWAANAMPDSGIVIGWQLADAIVAPLLDASAGSDPIIGRAFLDRLTKLTTALSVDLAIPHGGAAALQFDEVVSARGIEAPRSSDGDIESAWAFGNATWLREHIAAQAIAVWRLWLTEANGMAEPASAAFAAWLTRKR